MIVDIDGPVHEHDCDSCTYLGSIAPLAGATGGQPADLYVCGGDSRTLISRTGIDGEYLSMPAAIVADTYFGPIPNDGDLAPLFRELFTRAAKAGAINPVTVQVPVVSPIGMALEVYLAVHTVLGDDAGKVEHRVVGDSMVIDLKDIPVDAEKFTQDLTAALAEDRFGPRTATIVEATVLG